MQPTIGTMKSTSHDSTSTGRFVPRLWAGISDELRVRRRDRAAHAALRRELATYSTPAEVDDLLGALSDHDDSAAEEIRSILFSNLVWRQQSGRLAC